MHDDASFTALDWIAVAVVAMMSLALLTFPFTVVPSFERMFSDVCASLPTITRVMLTPWAAPLMGLVAGSPAMIAAGLAPTHTIGLRRALVVTGFLLCLTAIAAALYALYAPIFAFAGNIKAD